MNPDNTLKTGKFLCGCCAKPEEFNSDEVIFDYFGKEFTEYEYVIENLAIRPAPKKLLDLVPVHSTNISSKSISKISGTKNQKGEPVQSTSSLIMSHNLQHPATGEGDFPKLKSNSLTIRDTNDDFISFKAPVDESQTKKNQPTCLPKPYSPYSHYPYRQPAEPKTMKDITELRQTIRSTEYRTAKQIISDLCQASEESLNIKPKTEKPNRPMPSDIEDTIETLKFKKPIPQFYTRTEKKLFHTPGVYFAEVKNSMEDIDKKTCDDITTFGPAPYNTRCAFFCGKHKRDRSEEEMKIITKKRPGLKATIKEKPDIRNIESDTSSDILQQGYGLDDGNYYAVDSTAQTEISKSCPCPKKNKKNLKWKIIINKHSNCKRSKSPKTST